jgi:hypothetical protein
MAILSLVLLCQLYHLTLVIFACIIPLAYFHGLFLTRIYVGFPKLHQFDNIIYTQLGFFVNFTN